MLSSISTYIVFHSEGEPWKSFPQLEICDVIIAVHVYTQYTMHAYISGHLFKKSDRGTCSQTPPMQYEAML